MRGEGRDAAIRCTVVGCPVLGAAFLLPRSALLTPRCGLNPLHCGAVVASPEEVTPRDAIWAVLIPFIAGQWSLPTSARPRSTSMSAFQSPSLRGSGRFARARRRKARVQDVSIPFIAGQWSLHGTPPSPEGGRAMFQSPSLRGSGRFLNGQSPRSEEVPGFNPLHCGAVVASFDRPARRTAGGQVSIPFIAGQWSLPAARARKDAERRVSIPFIAGQWSLQAERRAASLGADLFQSPSLRGSGRFPGAGPTAQEPA